MFVVCFLALDASVGWFPSFSYDRLAWRRRPFPGTRRGTGPPSARRRTERPASGPRRRMLGGRGGPCGAWRRSGLRRCDERRGVPWGGRPLARVDASMAESELLDDPAVPIEIRTAEVVEQPAPTADHLEQTPSTMVVSGMRAEMVGQLLDARRQERDLHRGGPLVVLVARELPDRVLFRDLVHVFFDPGSSPAGPCGPPPSSCKRFVYKFEIIGFSPRRVKTVLPRGARRNGSPRPGPPASGR